MSRFVICMYTSYLKCHLLVSIEIKDINDINAITIKIGCMNKIK